MFVCQFLAIVSLCQHGISEVPVPMKHVLIANINYFFKGYRDGSLYLLFFNTQLIYKDKE